MVSITSMAIPPGEETSQCAAMGDSPAEFPSGADAEARRLALAVSRGNEAAFTDLYDRYHGRLFRLAIVLGQADESLAHEIVQATMLTAAAKLKPVESEKHLWHWLARVARQKLLKQRRTRKREPPLVSLTGLADIPETLEADAVLEESLDAALLALDADERQAIEWFYFDGLGHADIAARLNTTAKAVSSRLERVRAKLRLAVTRMLSHET
jgi:RNA polymerase sigma-70 factor (ECF subfamily)